MKRKLIVVIAAAMLLLTLTGTAVAAGLNITSMKEFYDRGVTFLRLYGYDHDPFVFEETRVVKPKGYRHTSNLVDIVVDQMYLTDEALYFTVHYSPKSPNTLLFDTYHNTIMYNGEEKRYYHLWDQKELTLLELGSMTMDDLNGIEPLAHFDSIDATRDPETGVATFMYAFKHPQSIHAPSYRSGGTLMLRFQVRNLRNHAVEWNVLFIDFPRMEVVKTDAAN